MVLTQTAVESLLRGHPREEGKCPLNGGWAGFLCVEFQRFLWSCPVTFWVLKRCGQNGFNSVFRAQKSIHFPNTKIFWTFFQDEIFVSPGLRCSEGEVTLYHRFPLSHLIESDWKMTHCYWFYAVNFIKLLRSLNLHKITKIQILEGCALALRENRSCERILPLSR